jgi:hypothetical protein
MASSKQAGTMAKPSSSTRFLSALMVSASLEITFGISQNKHYASSVAKPGKSGTSSPQLINAAVTVHVEGYSF